MIDQSLIFTLKTYENKMNIQKQTLKRKDQ